MRGQAGIWQLPDRYLTGLWVPAVQGALSEQDSNWVQVVRGLSSKPCLGLHHNWQGEEPA